MIKKKFNKINNEEVKLLSSEIVNEGGAVLSNLFDLSTEETVIGTFDGKPIYRRIVINNGYATSFLSGAVNVDTVFRMEMLVRQNNTSGDWRNVPWLFNSNCNDVYGTAAWAGGFYFNSITGVVALQIGADLQKFNKMVFVIEYTKK